MSCHHWLMAWLGASKRLGRTSPGPSTNLLPAAPQSQLIFPFLATFRSCTRILTRGSQKHSLFLRSSSFCPCPSLFWKQCSFGPVPRQWDPHREGAHSVQSQGRDSGTRKPEGPAWARGLFLLLHEVQTGGTLFASGCPEFFHWFVSDDKQSTTGETGLCLHVGVCRHSTGHLALLDFEGGASFP